MRVVLHLSLMDFTLVIALVVGFIWLAAKLLVHIVNKLFGDIDV